MRLLVVLCSFLLITLVYSEEESEEEPIVIPEKIVKIRGTMNISDKYDRIAKYDEDETKCWKNSFCMAFYCLSPGKCRQFGHDTQVQATMNEPKDGDESYYGIRTILPNNECPSSYKDIVDFKYQSPDMLINSWRKVSGVWKFESCKPENWTRFERTNGKIVCLRGIKLEVGVSKEQAKSKCAELGAVLTGVASPEESDWMKDETKKVIGTSNNDDVFWLAGERQNPCTLGASWGYRTNIVWGDGLLETETAAMTEEHCDISCVSSEGEDERCWGILNRKNAKRIVDVPCGGSSYMQGAFCAYELYK